MCTYIHVHVCSICEGKDEAMASGGVIFQSVAGRETGKCPPIFLGASFGESGPG